MKTYIASSTTRDGDHEYGEQFVLKAKNDQEAEKKAKHELLRLYSDPDDSEFDADNRLDLFDTIVEFNCVNEIPRSHFKILEKYLYNSNL